MLFQSEKFAARAFASASRMRRAVSCADGNPFSSFGLRALAQRLQRLVDGLRRRRERRVALQRDPDALADEKGGVVEFALRVAEHERQRGRRRDRLHLLPRRQCP